MKTSVCYKCGIGKSGERSCCAQGGAWLGKCGSDGDSKFEHTWAEGFRACKQAPTTGGTKVFTVPLPCDQASDFNGDDDLGEGNVTGSKCRDLAPLMLPWSAEDCHTTIGDDSAGTKAYMLKYLYGRCCKPGSKPNGICGFKQSLPCDQASDFNGDTDLGDGQTCQDLSALTLPSSAAECSEKFGDSDFATKAYMLKYLYGRCCKPGSKPNAICGSKLTLPCDQASDFDGTKRIDESTCQAMSLAYLPSSAEECSEKFGDGAETKEFMLMQMYGLCCKPLSKPNGICGSKITLPCDQASDFYGDKIIDDHEQTTCSQIILHYLPQSVEQCGDKLGDGPATKGEGIKHIHSMCCKPGSKPNGMCGFELGTATPCEIKADGEFLPEAK